MMTEKDIYIACLKDEIRGLRGVVAQQAERLLRLEVSTRKAAKEKDRLKAIIDKLPVLRCVAP